MEVLIVLDNDTNSNKQKASKKNRGFDKHHDLHLNAEWKAGIIANCTDETEMKE